METLQESTAFKIKDPAMYGKALLTVIGADGYISAEEMEYFEKLVSQLGFSKALITALKSFDYVNSNIEDYLQGIQSNDMALKLLYTSMKVSVQDGLAPEEMESAAAMANLLAIHPLVFQAISGLVSMEQAFLKEDKNEAFSAMYQAINSMRVALLGTQEQEFRLEDVAQVEQISQLDIETKGVPQGFIQVVREFMLHMGQIENGILHRTIEDDALIQEKVHDTCEKFRMELLNFVTKYPEQAPAIGAYASRMTFPHFMAATINKRCYSKPLGYAGDYFTMEFIYKQEPSGEGLLGKYIDTWTLGRNAGKAVRERVSMMITQFEEAKADWAQEGNMPVCSIASGPIREIVEYHRLHPAGGIEFTCVDVDPRAIEYAQSQLAAHQIEGIEFIQDSVLKMVVGKGHTYLTPQKLIYSIGLIDYMKDRTISALLSWMYDHLESGGRVVLGQFHSSNEDKPYMDYIMDWVLYHRTEEEMKAIFEKSKFRGQNVDIRYDEHGIQMFCICHKP